MKYTEAEVIDIIKCATDKDPQEIFKAWANRKANTPLDLNKSNYPVFVYTFPIVVDEKEVADITLVDLSSHTGQSLKNDLMLKYFGKDDYDASWETYSHDTYLDCYLTIRKEFSLPEICEGMRGDTFQGVDANGRPFEFKVAYGYPEKDEDSDMKLLQQWVDKAYRFDNGVHITVNNRMNGWSLGQKINENVELRLIPYKRAEKLNGILD
jgi:hypothetical protein